MRKGFELILVTILAGFAADVIIGVVGCYFGLAWLNGLRSAASGEPHDIGGEEAANEQRFDDSVWIQPSRSFRRLKDQPQFRS